MLGIEINKLLATASFVSNHYNSVEPAGSNDKSLSRKQFWVPVKGGLSIKMLYKLLPFKLAIRRDACTVETPVLKRRLKN